MLDDLPEPPVVTSRARDWDGITVDVFRPMSRLAFHADARDHHLVCYCRSGSAHLVQARAGMTHESQISAGMSLIVPAGYDSTWDGAAAATIRLRLPVPLLERAADQAADAGGRRSGDPFELRNVFQTRDLMVERVAMVMMSELERRPHPVQRLIVDTMSCALAAHLLRGYNAFEFPEVATTHALGTQQLARLTEYIEDHLDAPIGLDELARIANISKFHFARVFKRSTGMTAIHYVEQRRIQHAKAMILETDLPLVEVALRAGFADQSHFTRRFNRHVGSTPGAFARECGRGRRAVRG